MEVRIPPPLPLFQNQTNYTLPKLIDFFVNIYRLNLKKKIFQFFVGVPLSGPLENIDIYFSKIDLNIFAMDTIFCIAETFYNKNEDFCKKN